jgi:hypothetical protein
METWERIGVGFSARVLVTLVPMSHVALL